MIKENKNINKKNYLGSCAEVLNLVGPAMSTCKNSQHKRSGPGHGLGLHVVAVYSLVNPLIAHAAPIIFHQVTNPDSEMYRLQRLLDMEQSFNTA